MLENYKQVAVSGRHYEYSFEFIDSDFNTQDFNKKSKKASDSNLIKQSQQALDGLGFNTHTPGTSYGENGRSAYNAYWESRFPELVEEGVIEKITTGNPPDDMLQFIVDEYNGSFCVDAEGFVNLNIPKCLLDAATNIDIGLQDFPVLLEATHQSEANSENNVLRENNNTGNGTNYQIRWGVGTEANPNDVTQSTEWNGNFGWHMKKDDRITQFKTSLQLTVKETDRKFSEFDKNLLSNYYFESKIYIKKLCVC